MGIKLNSKNGSEGRRFESEIEPSLMAYDEANIASMDFMPVPTRQIGMQGNMPKLVRTGKPPFDVYGYVMGSGLMIGAELKATSKPENRLSIVAPNSRGSGLQFHQLDALAKLAQNGGVARIVWSNAGCVGVLENVEIMRAWKTYMMAMDGRATAQGSKSIEWDRFTEVDYGKVGNNVCIDWLKL